MRLNILPKVSLYLLLLFVRVRHGYKLTLSLLDMKKLIDLTEEDFDKLNEIGMLYELYPEAPSTYEELHMSKLDKLEVALDKNASIWNEDLRRIKSDVDYLKRKISIIERAFKY